MTISYSLAETKHGTEVIAQLPRLAAFDHPSRLRAEDFWRDDAKIVRRWQSGAEPGCFIILARDRNGALAGAAMVRLMPEKMDEHASSHLETLTVAEGYEGKGIGAGLIAAAEAEAEARGALSITLHVFNRNQRALKLYERLGFESEIQRCIKIL
jgi:ribosomal protein S18 acetylase RimI-like enzyme